MTSNFNSGPECYEAANNIAGLVAELLDQPNVTDSIDARLKLAQVYATLALTAAVAAAGLPSMHAIDANTWAEVIHPSTET